MTRLVLAWALVALWFVGATAGIAARIGLPSRPPSEHALWAGVPVRLIKWRLVEAGLLTLFGSLWFDSLGTGQWWLVFLLVGAIATIPTWLAREPRLIGASADLVRYLLAGAILAWRLG